jgi:hypothetical protein
MIFFINFRQLDTKIINNEKYSLYLNEVRKNLAAPGKQLLSSPKSAYCWCSTTYIPVGDLDRSPLMRSYGYASAGDQSTLFAIFSLSFVPFIQYAG